MFKKSVLFLAFFGSLFISQSLYSQCKLERDKDDYSGVVSAYTKDVTLAKGFPLLGTKKPWKLKMNFDVTNNSKISLFITHESQSLSSSVSSLSFKFQDGTIIKDLSSGGSSDINNGFGTNLTLSIFHLTKEELMIFASKDLLKFKAVFNSNLYDPVLDENIKKKNIKKIRNDANCILSEVTSDTLESKDVRDTKNDSNGSCNYLEDEIDDFTKVRTVLTKPKMTYNLSISEDIQNSLNVCGSNINGTNGLQITRVLAYSEKYTVDQEQLKRLMTFNQIDLLLGNGEIVSLKDAVPSKFSKQYNKYYSYKIFTIDNDSIWKKLGKSLLKKLKISINGTKLDTQEIEKKYKASFMKSINCINILDIPKS